MYERFAQTVNRRVHAQGWSQTRRPFGAAARVEPRFGAAALARIGAFYHAEASIRAQGFEAEAKLAPRGAVTKPLVEAFFAWRKPTGLREVLLPANPFAPAAR